MNYQHELANNVLFLKLEGDMLGETDGMELVYRHWRNDYTIDQIQI